MSNTDKAVFINPFEVVVEYYGLNYRTDPNFWCKTSPLSAVSDKVDNETFGPLASIETFFLFRAAHLAGAMYYDFYNNGGGNAGRWSVSTEFKSAIRKAKLEDHVIKHLENRLSEVFTYIKKGRSFGWPMEGEKNRLARALEELNNDLVYLCGKKKNWISPDDKILVEKED